MNASCLIANLAIGDQDQVFYLNPNKVYLFKKELLIIKLNLSVLMTKM